MTDQVAHRRTPGSSYLPRYSKWTRDAKKLQRYYSDSVGQAEMACTILRPQASATFAFSIHHPTLSRNIPQPTWHLRPRCSDQCRPFVLDTDCTTLDALVSGRTGSDTTRRSQTHNLDLIGVGFQPQEAQFTIVPETDTGDGRLPHG